MGYKAAHDLLRKVRGLAKAYRCRCGEQAEHWAYVGPRVGGERKPWSFDTSLYEAMCHACHKRHDLVEIKTTDKHPGDVTLW